MFSEDDALALRKAGFTHGEIMEYGSAVAADGTSQRINIRAATWQDAIRTRHQWVVKMHRTFGWSKARIAAEINSWYRKGLIKSPFDFVKVEYKPPRRLTDYQEARKARLKQQIAVAYAGAKRTLAGARRR